MPGQHHRHWWFYINLKPNTFAHVGKDWYGVVWHRWAVLAWFIDRSWYEPATSTGIAVGPFEVGLFIEHTPRGQKKWEYRPLDLKAPEGAVCDAQYSDLASASLACKDCGWPIARHKIVDSAHQTTCE